MSVIATFKVHITKQHSVNTSLLKYKCSELCTRVLSQNKIYVLVRKRPRDLIHIRTYILFCDKTRVQMFYSLNKN